jgi:hypothetical protein
VFIGRHVKRQLFLSVLIKPEISRHILKKYTNIKCNENNYIGSQIFPYGRADGRTVMTQLIVALHNFANSPKQTTYPKVISWNITHSNCAHW